MVIADKAVVTLHYHLTDDEGQVLDSSKGKDPLKYLHGFQNIIPGLEDALNGKSKGDKMDVTVEAADGYGEVIDSLIQEVPAEVFKDVPEVKPGMVFQAEDNSGHLQNFMIRSVQGETVTIDANHPLAGKRLHFSVSVEDVREASPEELDHGHVH